MLTPDGDFASNLIRNDSLTLAVAGELFLLVRDNKYARTFIRVFNKLMTDSLMTSADLMQYLPDLLTYAQHRYEVIRQENDYAYTDWDLLPVLGTVNNTQVNAMLKIWLSLPNASLAYKAMTLLLNNDQALTAADVQRFAEDVSYRYSTYKALKKAKKEKLFPKKYLTQKGMAESVIYEYANDEYETSGLKFYKSETISFRGQKAVFYYFIVEYDEDEGRYLAVSGPYNPNASDLDAENTIEALYSDEGFSPDKFAEQKARLLERLSESLKELEGEG